MNLILVRLGLVLLNFRIEILLINFLFQLNCSIEFGWSEISKIIEGCAK